MTNLKALIGTLEVKDEFVFEYKGKEYRFKCFNEYKGEKAYSIWENKICGEGMNVDKLGGACVWLFSYDMMDTRTTYKMKFEDMEVKEVIRNEDAD